MPHLPDDPGGHRLLRLIDHATDRAILPLDPEGFITRGTRHLAKCDRNSGRHMNYNQARRPFFHPANLIAPWQQLVGCSCSPAFEVSLPYHIRSAY